MMLTVMLGLAKWNSKCISVEKLLANLAWIPFKDI